MKLLKSLIRNSELNILGLIYLIEKDLHEYYKDCKYVPLSKFKGSGECFDYVDIEHVKNYVYTLFKIVESNGE